MAKNEKILKATYGSDKTPLILGSLEIPCYVLEDNTRVFSGRGIQKALGANSNVSGTWLNRIVNKTDITPFILPDVLEKFNTPIKFKRPIGTGAQSVTYGYDVTLLIDLCDAILQANKSRAKVPFGIVENAEIIMRSVAKVGIVALVDEVTGFQQHRDKDALQSFLQKFLLEEKGKWIPVFPDEFFESIFRMKGWDWQIASNGKKPQVVGHYINNYVYSRIAPQVLVELRKLNPKNERGRRKGAYTQYIDVDYGHPKLKEHLNILIAFAKATGYNWNNFHRMVERALPKFEQDGSQAYELPFDDM